MVIPIEDPNAPQTKEGSPVMMLLTEAAYFHRQGEARRSLWAVVFDIFPFYNKEKTRWELHADENTVVTGATPEEAIMALESLMQKGCGLDDKTKVPSPE